MQEKQINARKVVQLVKSPGSKLVDFRSTSTLYTVWQQLVSQHANAIALHDPHAQPVLEWTYAQVYEQILQFAGGLQMLGVQAGDRVAIIAENSPRWLIADLGTLFAGMINVPRSAVADVQELAYILRHSGSTVVIVQDLKTWQRLREIITELKIFDVILLSDEVSDECISFQHLLKLSDGFVAPTLMRSHLATIMYTSGTTGQPKGVMLTHGNLMHQVETLDVVVRPQPGERVLSILPTWHCYERACEYFLLSKGCTLTYTDRRHLKQDLQAEQPHYLVAVPRIWEVLYEAIQQQVQQKGALSRWLFKTFINISERYITQRRIAADQCIEHLQLMDRQRLAAQRQQWLLAPLHYLGDRLIYHKIRQSIAPQLKYAITGGGSLPAYLDNFYEIIGVEILNGYGMTEASPVIAARRANWNIRGTVGSALSCTEIRIVNPETQAPLAIGETGLVLVRGPQVMKGYYNNPNATAQVLSANGWLNTGDLGWLTPYGLLTLTGRAKDTIVLLNGENIEPEPLENVCRQSPYISQIVVVGQDRKRLAVLIYPNVEAIANWAKTQGLQPLTEAQLLMHPRVYSLIKDELRQRVKQRSGYRADDLMSDFRFVPEPFSPDNGLTTQTLKIRRIPVAQRYSDLINSMYEA
ncbi:MAG: long-chain fatty acid--CoA ligase [Leptolyngbyaceae cyanobacterium RM1_406_9]|nr:long-chain fatty acid--CoA ligase [Leptolyngbyaceae cyanobacterium RM1_406_9]